MFPKTNQKEKKKKTKKELLWGEGRAQEKMTTNAWVVFFKTNKQTNLIRQKKKIIRGGDAQEKIIVLELWFKYLF